MWKQARIHSLQVHWIWQLNPETIINVDNIKPGDWMNRTFKLKNNGSLDISKVFLTTEFTESVAGFGDHIVVEFLKTKIKAVYLELVM